MTLIEESKALTDALHSAITLMWPKRTQQEKLLDLGEQKPWSRAMARKAVAALSHWLWTEVFIETCVEPATRKPVAKRAVLQALGQNLATSVRRDRANHVGVAAWICAISGSVGGSPKTLSNSISAERSSNPTHRWLRLISRVQANGVPEDAWLYHRRSVSSVLAEILAWNNATAFDAGDAMLVFSLIALWQRRRPTQEVLANRQQSKQRTKTPKPIVALGDSTMQLGQLRELLALSALLVDPQRRVLVLVAIEAALTVAHLTAHRARKSKQPLPNSNPWHALVKAALVTPQPGLLPDDIAVLKCRLEMTQAYSEKLPISFIDEDCVSSAYLRASRELQRSMINPERVDQQRINPRADGVLMLLPSLRKRNLLEP